MDNQANSLLNFQIRRDIVSLYKRFLTIVEDIRHDHQSMLQKLEKELPPQYHYLLRNGDYFSMDKSSYIRKKILDAGNESIRGMDEQIRQFDVQFGKQEKGNNEQHQDSI